MCHALSVPSRSCKWLYFTIKSEMNKGPKYGKIQQKHFVWNIQDFINIIKKVRYNIDSPDFQFEGETWNLNLQDSGPGKRSEQYYTTTRIFLVLNSSDVSDVSTTSYRLHIKNAEGGDYWTSPMLTDKFSASNRWGTVQKLNEGELVNDASKILSGNTLSLYVTFQPPGQGTVIASTTERRTIEIGVQTCLNLPQQNCSSYSDDPDKLLQNLRDLLLNGQKSDVTLNVKGKEYKAHQNILACRSPVFCKMFDHNMLEQSRGSVEITDCSPDIFDIFLLYAYTGQVENLTINKVVDLYSIADKYDVKELAKGCVSYMLCNMCVEAFGDFVSLALRHCEEELLQSANMFFAQNLKEIVASDKWKSFNAQNPAQASELLVKALDEIKFLVLFNK